MIIVSHGEIKMLRGGGVREITVRKPRPRPQAKKAKCRWVAGQDYNVTARATFDEDGKPDKKQTTIRCLVLSVAGDEITETHWTLTLTIKAQAEHSVWMASDPAAMETDYVTTPAKSASGDSEVFGESAERVLAKLKEKDEDKPRKVKRADALKNITKAIRELEDVATVSERGQLQRLKAQQRRLQDAA